MDERREVGTWTCPADFSDERGRPNPKWWNDNWTQYGFLKMRAVDDPGSYIDGVPVSELLRTQTGRDAGRDASRYPPRDYKMVGRIARPSLLRTVRDRVRALAFRLNSRSMPT
ncbi:MAG: hypothetical protein HRF45_13970 [Fimbriimonadia bacterium]|jgi:hypothetical protein